MLIDIRSNRAIVAKFREQGKIPVARDVFKKFQQEER